MTDASSKYPKKILVVDDDESILQFIVNALEEAGCQFVTKASDGEEAWEKSQEEKYDLIIMDWRIPGVSGLGLINRLRSSQHYQRTPVMVISGFLGSKDFSLLSELPLSGKLEKPFKIPFLLRAMSDLKKEAGWFSTQESRIVKLLKGLKANGDETTLTAVKKLVFSSPKPLRLAMVAARVMRESKYYDGAEQLLRIALSKNENSPHALNELGKLYLETGRANESKALLLKAMDLSPDNIDRLCDLADLSLREFDTDGAKEYIGRAKELDGNNTRVMDGETLMDNIDEFFRYNGAASIPESYAGLLNAIGITMVREGEYEKGMRHYKSAMAYIKEPVVQSKLAFNLGLGYARWEKKNEALSWFNKCLELDPDNSKAKVHINRLELLAERDDGGLQPASISTITEEETYSHDDVFDIGGDESIGYDLDETQAMHSELFAEMDSPAESGESMTRLKLEKLCPAFVDLFDKYQEEGGYVDAQVPLFCKLLDQYGAEVLAEVIPRAIQQGALTATAVSNLLQIKAS